MGEWESYVKSTQYMCCLQNNIQGHKECNRRVIPTGLITSGCGTITLGGTCASSCAKTKNSIAVYLIFRPKIKFTFLHWSSFEYLMQTLVLAHRVIDNGGSPRGPASPLTPCVNIIPVLLDRGNTRHEP